MTLRRTPLKSSTPLQRTAWLRRLTPLRTRPSPRARPDEPLSERCEAEIPVCCTGRAEHRHHLLRRSQGGGDEAANTRDVCGPCHRHIHDNPAWAVSAGLLRRAWDGAVATLDRALDEHKRLNDNTGDIVGGDR